MSLSLLEIARQKYIDGDEKLAQSFYERAVKEGVPNDIVLMQKITRGYLLFPLDFISADEYFSLLFRLKELCGNEEYKAEYIKAIDSLINIKKLFLRELSLYYFSELAICYQNSMIVKHIHELFDYLCEHLEDIAENDCYEIRYNNPGADMKKLKIDLMEIKAFCLNILLSYSAVQDSVYTGTTYHAYTYDCGWYSSTSISSTDNYTNRAVIKPRLNMVGLEAYYDEYLAEYNKIVKEINNYISFDSPKELRKELSRLVEYKENKDISDKEFNMIAKRLEKQDISRQSLVKTSFGLLKFNPIVFIFKPLYEKMYKMIYGMNEIGSFETDTYFTRKKIWGVCDMISSGSHWSIETVRCLMAGLIIFGGPLYLILGTAMKFGFYLPSITIEKH